MEAEKPRKSVLSVRIAAKRLVKARQKLEGFDNKTRNRLINAAVREFYQKHMH